MSPAGAFLVNYLSSLFSLTLVVFVFGMAGLAFGFDRAGFRAYVLSPVPRGDVLLGKNLAASPVVLGLGLLGSAAVGAVYPMRAGHHPAVAAQWASTYLIACVLLNVPAILAPVPMAAGSAQPAGVTLGPVLLQMMVMLVLPVLVLPVLVPYGLAIPLDELDVVRGVPVSLPLSVVVLALAGLVYRWAVRRQGRG